MGRALLIAAIASAAVGLLMGCGGPSTPTLVTIQGKISLDGKPLEAGNLILHSEDSKQGGWGGMVSSGSYTASAPVGKYKVTVEPIATEDPPPPQIDAKYQKVSTTPLSVTVVSNAAPGAYDLEGK